MPPGSVYIGTDPHEEEREKLELNFVDNENVKLDRLVILTYFRIDMIPSFLDNS